MRVTKLLFIDPLALLNLWELEVLKIFMPAVLAALFQQTHGYTMAVINLFKSLSLS